MDDPNDLYDIKGDYFNDEILRQTAGQPEA
jgi:hypothetical protein